MWACWGGGGGGTCNKLVFRRPVFSWCSILGGGLSRVLSTEWGEPGYQRGPAENMVKPTRIPGHHPPVDSSGGLAQHPPSSNQPSPPSKKPPSLSYYPFIFHPLLVSITIRQACNFLPRFSLDKHTLTRPLSCAQAWTRGIWKALLCQGTPRSVGSLSYRHLILC